MRDLDPWRHEKNRDNGDDMMGVLAFLFILAALFFC